MEEATGAPSSLAVSVPKRLRASGRHGGTVMTEPPSPLRMLLSRHTRRRVCSATSTFGLHDVCPNFERAADPLHRAWIGPNCLAITRTPGLPGVARAFLMRSSSSGAIRGRLAVLPSLLAPR